MNHRRRRRYFGLSLAVVYFSTQCAFAHRLSLPPATPSTAPTILHIQDVHMNSEAQQSIDRKIQDLIRRHQVDLIAVEGAFGPIDLSVYHRFSDQSLIRPAANYLLRENKIS